MSTFRIFGTALRAALLSPRLWIAFYLCSLAFSAVAAYAFHSFMAKVDGVAALEPLFSDFDLMLAGDFLGRHGDAINALMGLVLPLAILSVTTYAILSGGTLALLLDREPAGVPGLLEASPSRGFRSFAEASGRFASRCFRLLFLSAVLTGLVFTVLTALAGVVIALAAPGGGSEVPGVVATGSAIVVGAFVVMLAVMVGDYARVLTVVDDDRAMLPEMWKSARVLLKNAGGAIGLQLLFVLLNAGVILLYLVIEGGTGTGNWLLVGLLVVIQQLLMIIRAMLRVGLLAGQLGFTAARRVQPALEVLAI